MHHVEFARDALHRAIGALAFKGGDAIRAIDGDKLGFEIELDAIFFDIAHQRRHILRHAE